MVGASISLLSHCYSPIKVHIWRLSKLFLFSPGHLAQNYGLSLVSHRFGFLSWKQCKTQKASINRLRQFQFRFSISTTGWVQYSLWLFFIKNRTLEKARRSAAASLRVLSQGSWDSSLAVRWVPCGSVPKAHISKGLQQGPEVPGRILPWFSLHWWMAEGDWKRFRCPRACEPGAASHRREAPWLWCISHGQECGMRARFQEEPELWSVQSCTYLHHKGAKFFLLQRDLTPGSLVALSLCAFWSWRNRKQNHVMLCQTD